MQPLWAGRRRLHVLLVIVGCLVGFYACSYDDHSEADDASSAAGTQEEPGPAEVTERYGPLELLFSASHEVSGDPVVHFNFDDDLAFTLVVTNLSPTSLDCWFGAFLADFYIDNDSLRISRSDITPDITSAWLTSTITGGSTITESFVMSDFLALKDFFEPGLHQIGMKQLFSCQSGGDDTVSAQVEITLGEAVTEP